MCRSIKLLRVPGQPATDEELNAAALQFIRKISGYRKPSKSNQAAFEAAVEEVAIASRRLLDQLPVKLGERGAGVSDLATQEVGGSTAQNR